jgi:hypothetical protein
MLKIVAARLWVLPLIYLAKITSGEIYRASDRS